MSRQILAPLDLAGNVISRVGTPVAQTDAATKGLVDAKATILTGHGAPLESAGVDGDFFLDVDAHILYGPKNGSWPVALTPGNEVVIGATQPADSADLWVDTSS